MMPKTPSHNIEMLGAVARGIKGLKEKVVFVGGATIDLFITDPAAPVTRTTIDVDCVVEIARRVEFYALEEELRACWRRSESVQFSPVNSVQSA